MSIRTTDHSIFERPNILLDVRTTEYLIGLRAPMLSSLGCIGCAEKRVGSVVVRRWHHYPFPILSSQHLMCMLGLEGVGGVRSGVAW